MNKYFIFLLLILWLPEVLAKKNIKVGLEPAPPLITIDGQGILNKFLKEVESHTQYTFSIEYMTYGRALLELKKGRLDLVGVTPTGNETKSFYTFAQDLDWSFETYNVVFFKKKHLNVEKVSEFKVIGTPAGNEVFMQEMMNFPTSRFHGGPLESLFKMLEKNRLDAIIFESISAMTTLKKLALKDIQYKKLNRMKGGFSVLKSNEALRDDLNRAISKIDTKKFFKDVEAFQELKDVPYIK